MELYVMSLNEAVIVKPLVSEAPLMREGKITTAAPEKMLVDIVAEPDIFVAQQGELEHIFENIFSQILKLKKTNPEAFFYIYKTCELLNPPKL